jgi:agmatine deiminase
MMKRRTFVGGASSMLSLSGCSMPIDFLAGTTAPKVPSGISYPSGSFVMPDEASPHLRTFMQWPVHADIYEGAQYLRETQQSIVQIATTISQFEPVVILSDKSHHDQIDDSFGERTTGYVIELWDIPTDDLWARDAGPCFVHQSDGRNAIMDFNFNGWGNKQRHGNDALVARRIAERIGIPRIDSGLVGEAGGLEFDGSGTILAHASSWVNPNRNRGDAANIGAKMMQALGAKKVIWAPGIIGRDITDYHIDALARFVGPGHVLIQLPDKPIASDPWSMAAYETYAILKNTRDAAGRKLDITVIPDAVKTRSNDDDFVASYVNYYVCNEAVIAAEFGDDKADEVARATLAMLYPRREIVMLNVDPIGAAGGGIHCATQQQPVAKI